MLLGLGSYHLRKKLFQRKEDLLLETPVEEKLHPKLEAYYQKKLEMASEISSSDTNFVPKTLAKSKSNLITYEQLTFEGKIGEGGFSIVFKGIYDGKAVAIKKLKSVDPNTVTHFCNEMELLCDYRHENIINLYGVVIHHYTYCLVMEYMSDGSLYQMLQAGTQLYPQQGKIILDIALGMEHLHHHKVIHRDMKSPNILLKKNDNGEFSAKLCDFGLAIVQQEDTTQSQRFLGSVRWTAPEGFQGKKYLSYASDVYSFGVVVWEIQTGKKPLADTDIVEIPHVITSSNERPEIIPETCSYKMSTLIKFCWQKKANTRPSAEKIVQYLKNDGTDSSILESQTTTNNNNAEFSYDSRTDQSNAFSYGA